MLAGVGAGLLAAWILSMFIAQTGSAAARESRMGLAILGLAGILVLYRIQSTCGVCQLARRFYGWLGEGDVEVDG